MSTGKANPLWTRDFTIITLGSVVSMLGNAMSGFAVSLMVLDYTDSNLLYAIYVATFTVPQIIMPILSGAILDRFSRRKTIYMLDFISAALFAVMAAVLYSGFFSFPVFAVYCLILGSIQSIYNVAYQSFYPLLITEGNYSKAYSIESVLQTTTVFIVPISSLVYDLVGLPPLMAFNALSFLVAAIMETQIRAEEHYIEKQKKDAEGDRLSHSARMLKDIREGFRYLWSEKGLLRVACYFTFTALSMGAVNVIGLPYFRRTFKNGAMLYALVQGFTMIGRGIGGAYHYRHKLPVHLKFTIALIVYVSLDFISAVYLFTPIPVMMALTFLRGIGGITSYTIRISATQSYVPDEKKGRFNGAFNMLNTVGALTGQLSAGVLTSYIAPRTVQAVIMSLCIVAALFFIGGGKKDVAAIYNRQQ